MTARNAPKPRGQAARYVLIGAIVGYTAMTLTAGAGARTRTPERPHAPTELPIPDGDDLVAAPAATAPAPVTRAGWSVRRRLVLLLWALGLAAGITAGAAWAYWGGIAASGANGTATAASIGAQSAPGAVVGGAQGVAVSWPATTLSDGHAVAGYLVKRYDAGTSALQSTGTGCSGTITTLSCTEAAVPLGSWKYTVTPLIGTNWQGPESSKSAQVSVGAAVLTLARTTFGAQLSTTTTGTLTGFGVSEGLTYRLDANTVLSGSPATTDSGGGATITALTIPDGTTEGAHTVYAVGANGSLASFNIVVDLTAPTASALLGPAANGAGWNNTSPVLVTLSGTDGAGSGVSEIRYTLDGSDPLTSGTALAYSAPISVATTTTIRYYATDGGGNVSVVQTQVVSIDTTAPVNALTLNNVTGSAVLTGTTVTYRGAAAGSFTLTNAVSDPAGSGPASSGTAELAGTSTGFSHTSTSVTTPAGGPYVSTTFTWTAATTSSPTETVTGTDVAGNTVTTMLTFVSDATGPSGGSVDATGLVGTGSSYSTSTTLSLALVKGTDANGVATSGAQLLRATGTLTSPGNTNGVCGSYGEYTLITGGTDPASPKADTVADQACYSYRYIVVDNLGNPTTYTSGDIKVDTTAPSAPTLAFSALSNTYPVGMTVYYKSAETTGSFTATAAAADLASGIASYAFPALGTNWTSTPGATGVHTYSWTGVPAAPGTKNITATSNAGATSTGTAVTLVADDNPPSGGTVSHIDGYATGPSVTVTFTNGTDNGGSGLNPAGARLKRTGQPLVNGVCSGTTTIVNISNVTSPHIDNTVVSGNCYTYQLVMPDNLGNTAYWNSGSTTKVDYANAVATSSGLVSYWRMGETAINSSDNFTDPTGTVLSSHTSQTQTTWTRKAGDTINAVITPSGMARRNGLGDITYYSSAVPASADYLVEADLRYQTYLDFDIAGVVGRLDPAGTGSGTFYTAGYDGTNWRLWKKVNGTTSGIGGTGYTQALTLGSTHRVGLDMKGSRIRLLVNGIERVTVQDASIPGPGRAGIQWSNGTNAATDSNGMLLDEVEVSHQAIDSKGTNTGDYHKGPLLGVAGGLIGDTNTAAQFDGTNDHMQALTTIAPTATPIPVGAAARTVEMWFKTPGLAHGQARQALYNYGSVADGQAFAAWLEAGGTQIKFSASAAAFDRVFTFANFNDNRWHHFAITYDGTAVKMYVDGVAGTGGSATLTLNTVADTHGFTVGRMAPDRGGLSTASYFNGSLDEVAIYNYAMPPATVLEHFKFLEQGPVGGSVDATGLTAARFATPTALTIALNKGTDSDGIPATGALLYRASGTLASNGTAVGTCTGWSVYTQVSGTADAATKSDTIPATNAACYRYQYVVTDNIGAQTTYISGEIKVDTTASTTPTLAFTAGTSTYVSGGTLYYDPDHTSGATGSFTVTATATDTNSGIASYNFASLGASWTGTPGALGVHAYTWTSTTPEAPGTPTVSATNYAGIASANATFTPVADSTAPTAGSVTYNNATYPTASIQVSFTSGTDSGSGLNTAGRVLQRATAPNNSGTCGTFTGYTTIGAANPTSPYTDTAVSSANCYQYQYVTADNVGNVQANTSANIAKISAFGPYAAAVLATSGLVGYWRLGETFTSNDTFTDTTGTTLSAHTGEAGASWLLRSEDTVPAVVTATGTIRHTGAGGSAYYTSTARA
ncbi:MAG TPA: LamG-like jellyroll fold domain-containing protein, partial [Micromonosporaceae bacterium]|nr:LamG-like jellyroll fold domain-containing protein [Micromonosporaceae bacterium]